MRSLCEAIGVKSGDMLFKLLGQQAASALVSASLFAREGRLPGLEAFLDLNV